MKLFLLQLLCPFKSQASEYGRYFIHYRLGYIEDKSNLLQNYPIQSVQTAAAHNLANSMNAVKFELRQCFQKSGKKWEFKPRIMQIDGHIRRGWERTFFFLCPRSFEFNRRHPPRIIMAFFSILVTFHFPCFVWNYRYLYVDVLTIFYNVSNWYVQRFDFLLVFQKLTSSGKQPAHPKWFPLTFFTARGEDVQVGQPVYNSMCILLKI